MTVPNQVREAIYQRFQDNWVVPLVPGPGTAQRTPFCFDNEVADPWDEPWVRVLVRHVRRRQISLGTEGNRRFESRAMLQIEYREPPGRGVRTMDEHLQPACDLFEAKRLTGTTIWFQEILPQELGVIEDGKWWGAVAQGMFTYEQIK